MSEEQKEFEKKTPGIEVVDKRHTAMQPVVQPDLPATIGPMEIMMEAVHRGAGKDELEVLKELFKFQKEVKAEESKEAYNKAMAEFKKNPPEILKTAHVKYKNKDGTFTEYDHAKLGEICEAICERMGEYGLYPTWDMEIKDQLIWVPCIISHELGHSTKYGPICSGPDTSGGKNSIQAMSSTNTYLQRISLLGATGLAAKGMDDDGQAAGVQDEFITADEAKSIESRVKSLFGDNTDLFMTWLESGTGAQTIDTIPAIHLKSIQDTLTKQEADAKKKVTEKNKPKHQLGD